MRVLRIGIVSLGLSFSLLALAAPLRRVPVGARGNASLWLPAETSESQGLEAADLYRAYVRAWTTFFGAPPALPAPFVLESGGDLREGLFMALWRASGPRLAPFDRPAAYGALRTVVLKDPTPLMEALARVSAFRRIDERTFGSVLSYLFLVEEVQDPSFLPRALPPGSKGGRIKEAAAGVGLPWEAYRNRFASWLLARTVENRILAVPETTLPALWIVDEPMRPGRFVFRRVTLSDLEEGVDLQAAGGQGPGLELISLYTDEKDLLVQVGVGLLSSSPMVLPKRAKKLWLVLWNASPTERGDGLVLTLWKDYEPPFVVRRVELEGGRCDLTLQERGGIAEYDLWARAASGAPLAPLPLPPFSSKGAGLHRYSLAAPGITGKKSGLHLFCRMASGGTQLAPLSPTYGTLP